MAKRVKMRSMSIRLILSAALLATAPAPLLAQTAQGDAATKASTTNPDVFDVQVVARHPHDPDAFTQGLLWHEGHLYESTGQEGRSQVRKVDLATGEVLARTDLPADQFGEGLALWGDDLVNLTWLDGKIHRWSLETLAPLRTDEFPYEGWGLTTLGDDLVASDGSASLRFLDPDTYEVRREVEVTYNGRPLTKINEMEAVDGLIYANVWYSPFIVAIDPADGVVRRVIDLRPLVDSVPPHSSNGVLNGIAHDPETGRWFVTGKLWPSLFEVRFIPREEAPPEP